MNHKKLFFPAAITMLLAASLAWADEGMWLFNKLPVRSLKANYDFEPTPEWTDTLMKSCVRFNVGGSASFVSSNGLVLTNHHVGSDTLHKLSSEGNDCTPTVFTPKHLTKNSRLPISN